jgi:hypothetical protein
MKSEFSDLIDAKIPDLLFHYTDAAGLLGIIDSRKLWMTKVQYLNDKSELNYAFDLMREEIDQQKKGINRTRPDDELNCRNRISRLLGFYRVY